MNLQKISISIVLIVAVVGSIVYLNSQKIERVSTGEAVSVTPRLPDESKKDEITPLIPKSNTYPLAKEITTPDGFINTDGQPVTIGEFVGKEVVLLDIWTYSCINCQRTTPYLNAWYEKYKDKGLVIIGLHTPEFEFEKVYQNVLDSTQRLGIKYPVVLDNDYSTWNAYQNRFWPRKYLIDIDGYVIYDHIGEGFYEETEQKIQGALAERMAILGESGTITTALTKETAVTSGSRSPETYFGSDRNEYLGNGKKRTAGSQTFALPTLSTLNTLYLGGTWNIQNEYAEAVKDAKVRYRFTGRHMYVVGSAPMERSIGVTLDGVRQTSVTVSTDRLYTLISLPEAEEHTLELTVPSGVKFYAFTFG